MAGFKHSCGQVSDQKCLMSENACLNSGTRKHDIENTVACWSSVAINTPTSKVVEWVVDVIGAYSFIHTRIRFTVIRYCKGPSS